MESQIQDQQLTDFSQQMYTANQLEYDKGFEAGKTQASVAFMDGGSLYNYTDGYHAAISQFGTAAPDGHGLTQDALLDMLLSSFSEDNETEDFILNVD